MIDRKEFEEKIEIVREIAKVMTYDYNEYDAMNNNPTPEEEAVKILDTYLTTQLQNEVRELLSKCPITSCSFHKAMNQFILSIKQENK